MTAAVTSNMASAVAGVDGVNFTCDDIPVNDETAFDADEYPTSPAIVYRFRARKSGEDDLLSEPFSPNGGTHSWYAIVFPASGTWAVSLRDVSDDSEVATMNQTVT